MKLVSSRRVGKRHVYDIEVKDTHNFVTNDIVVHNCTSQGAQRLFVRGKPRSIIDIAALTSIYRPGPLAANVDKLWLKHAEEPYDWGHPLLNETLNETRGLLVFQEGVMALANKVGGFPMEQTDEVRRAIMKRSISGGAEAKAKAKALEDDFVNGAVEKGVPLDIAKKAYQTILWMSGYGFNKCLHSNSKVIVTDSNGLKTSKSIKDVVPGELIASRDEKSGKDIDVKVRAVHNNGKKKLVRVKLKTGETVECTMDHKFRTMETGEMLPLHEIMKKGLSIVVRDSKN